MKILIAEDDLISRRLLEATLTKWGYEVAHACDGLAAWEALQQPDAPSLAILDWMMPGLDGVEVCRRIRAIPACQPRYLLLLTAKGDRADIVAGLQAGADDHVAKPFDPGELQARLQVGVRMIQLQRSLNERVQELEDALSQIKRLRGLLPICAYCKKIRDDTSYWQEVEGYISKHAEVQFSHGICPGCYEQFVKPELDRMRSERAAEPDPSCWPHYF